MMRAILCAFLFCSVVAEVSLNFNNFPCNKPAAAGDLTEKHVEAALQTIITRGYLNCGSPTGGASAGNVTAGTDQGTGFWPDLCRAHAAALFGDYIANHATRLKFTVATGTNRWDLHQEHANLVCHPSTITSERTIIRPVFFSTPAIYDGVAVVAHTASGITNEATLFASTGKKLCFATGTTVGPLTITKFSNFQSFEELPDTAQSANLFKEGESCHAIASDYTDLLDHGVVGFVGTVLAAKGLSKEPLACFAFAVDLQAFSEAVMNGLIIAAEKGYKQSNAMNNEPSQIYPPEVGMALVGREDFMQTVIAAVGNLDEIYLRYYPSADRGLSAVFPAGIWSSTP